MTEEPPDELERHRAELYARLAGTGDFRRGSVNETWRRCGKPNRACAQPDHPGDGPRYLWTRSAGGRTRTRQLAGAELDKVRDCGLAAAEAMIRAGMLKPGGGVLGLEPSEVARLLASCDRRRADGRRDYAILLLLARLGLRAGEVAALRLDDADWRHGEIVVRARRQRQITRQSPTKLARTPRPLCPG